MMSDYNQHEEWEEQGEEIEIEAIGIDVSSQPIELYKVFKIANLVGGGGEAKHLISEGYVAVNGELETRKRRKMYDGDFFEFNQEYYVVVCDAPVTEPEIEEKPEPKAAKPAKQKPAEKKSKPAKTANKQSKPAKSNKAGKGGKSAKAPADNKPKKKNENGRGSIDFF
ncbi:RNA-binding S4 domain-containing protein [Vibrio fluminensis]|uniref:RNA-binding S4 domain-containing protein n=1 Tax=Vibrio fluminensis TaxID=2783614 RepID=UPI001887A18B|nr:RNA-binding S4 domain-containing protein [Vibrio fluminensis]